MQSLIDDLVIAFEEDPNLKVILGFRSEFAAYLQPAGFGRDSYAPVLRDACKHLYLLYSKGSGEKAITRLSHDSLAEVIYGRYSRLTEEKVATVGALALESLKREIDGQIDTLQYRQALDKLDQMMTVQEHRQELYPYFFE